MSQLLGRIVLKKQRPFSTAATPYLLSNSTNRRVTRDEFTVDLNLYDPMKEEQVKIPDHTLPMELVNTLRIGSSRGWLALKNLGDNTVNLTNMLNPCASVSSHKVITLPPLNDTRAYGICLLASPNEQEDCVVAAKSCSNLISLCRPGDSDWTQIKLPQRSLYVMYSARDNKFYLHKKKKECADNNIIECSSSFPQVCLSQSFTNSDLPESKRNLFISSSKTKYLIESPSGESFIVYWCDDFMTTKKPSCASYKRTPTTFVVFRQDHEQRINSYTEDIGDLCIFLGIGGDAFCVSATEYPGLKPNSIYYAARFTGFGFYDLASNTLHPVVDEPAYSDSYTWLAPLSH